MIQYEFLGKPHDFNNTKEISDLETRIGSKVLTVNQIHSNKIVSCYDLTEKTEADGVFIPKGEKFAAGVRTADCVPILLYSPDGIAAVHAGWRGLKAGIIDNALCFFRSAPKALIGPCAGVSLYEVGEEVISGFNCVYERRDSKIFLDLRKTAAQFFSDFELSTICTISNTKYHSHRRDKDKRGSNFSWIMFSDS